MVQLLNDIQNHWNLTIFFYTNPLIQKIVLLMSERRVLLDMTLAIIVKNNLQSKYQTKNWIEVQKNTNQTLLFVNLLFENQNMAKSKKIQVDFDHFDRLTSTSSVTTVTEWTIENFILDSRQNDFRLCTKDFVLLYL